MRQGTNQLVITQPLSREQGDRLAAALQREGKGQLVDINAEQVPSSDKEKLSAFFTTWGHLLPAAPFVAGLKLTLSGGSKLEYKKHFRGEQTGGMVFNLRGARVIDAWRFLSTFLDVYFPNRYETPNWPQHRFEHLRVEFDDDFLTRLLSAQQRAAQKVWDQSLIEGLLFSHDQRSRAEPISDSIIEELRKTGESLQAQLQTLRTFLDHLRFVQQHLEGGVRDLNSTLGAMEQFLPYWTTLYSAIGYLISGQEIPREVRKVLNPNDVTPVYEDVELSFDGAMKAISGADVEISLEGD